MVPSKEPAYTDRPSGAKARDQNASGRRATHIVAAATTGVTAPGPGLEPKSAPAPEVGMEAELGSLAGM